MPYLIAGEKFANKRALTEHCREILGATPDGADVADIYLPFLFGLFRHHDEWSEKASPGVRRIATHTTDHGTRCFVLKRADGSAIDISFPHSIKLIRGTRTRDLLPQRLLDYRSAARTAVVPEIRCFRDGNLEPDSVCPISKIPLTRDTCAVDHVAPLTFDRLLFEFTKSEDIDPLVVDAGSRHGTVAYFQDTDLSAKWVEYHGVRAELRLVSRVAHAQIGVPAIDWSPLLKH